MPFYLPALEAEAAPVPPVQRGPVPKVAQSPRHWGTDAAAKLPGHRVAKLPGGLSFSALHNFRSGSVSAGPTGCTSILSRKAGCCGCRRPLPLCACSR